MCPQCPRYEPPLAPTAVAVVAAPTIASAPVTSQVSRAVPPTGLAQKAELASDCAMKASRAALKSNTPALVMVGLGGQKYFSYRPLTQSEWTNRAIQARLLSEHERNGGWRLLEQPLVANHTLHVAEGCVKIENMFVTAVDHSDPKDFSIRSLYVVKLLGKSGDWTMKKPSLDVAWTCTANDLKGHPCLFIRSVRIWLCLKFCLV
jgi:hypothetical protein